MIPTISFFFFFNDTATTEIYTLSLHDALPIWPHRRQGRARARLVRPLDAQGTVPARGQEDDRPRARRRPRLADAGRAALPDGRRHGARRDPEGVRGASGDGLALRRDAALLRRPG